MRHQLALLGGGVPPGGHLQLLAGEGPLLDPAALRTQPHLGPLLSSHPWPGEHLYLVAVLLVGEGALLLLPLPPGADGLVVVVTLLLCPRPLLLLLDRTWLLVSDEGKPMSQDSMTQSLEGDRI